VAVPDTRTCSVIAKFELAAGGWPELLPSLQSSVASADPVVRGWSLALSIVEHKNHLAGYIFFDVAILVMTLVLCGAELAFYLWACVAETAGARVCFGPHSLNAAFLFLQLSNPFARS
jgi:hypothetical protein